MIKDKLRRNILLIINISKKDNNDESINYSFKNLYEDLNND